MPTYAYRCPDCGPFERFRRMDERDAPATCPECDAPASRMLTAGRVVAAGEEGTPANDAGAYPRMRHAGGCSCC